MRVASLAALALTAWLGAAPRALAEALDVRLDSRGRIERLLESFPRVREGALAIVTRLTMISPVASPGTAPDVPRSPGFSDPLADGIFRTKTESRVRGATIVRVSYRRAADGGFAEANRETVPIETHDNGSWPGSQAATGAAAGSAAGKAAKGGPGR